MKIDNEIIKRLMNACNYETKTILAKKHGMTLANFVNKQNAGTLWEIIVNECIEHNVSIDWIKTGNGSMFLSEAESSQRVTDDLESREGISSTKEVDNTIRFSCTEKSLSLHQQLEHICRDGSEKQINAVAAILEGTEQSIMQFEAIMAEMLKLSKKIDQLETTLKSERRIPGAASQDNQTRRNAK